MAQRPSQPRLLIIVPAYNEEASISSVVREITACVPSATILVVDDGSTDLTLRAAQSAGALAVHLPVNLGIGGAVQTGFIYAVRHSFSVCVQLDGDGQHDAAEVSRLIAPILEGTADLVVGSRWLGRGQYTSTPTRRLGMKLLSAMVRWRTAFPISDPTSGFRASSRRAIEVFAQNYPTDYPEVQAFLICRDSGLTATEVPVGMRPRKYGQSSIAGLRSVYYMILATAAITFHTVKRR